MSTKKKSHPASAPKAAVTEQAAPVVEETVLGAASETKEVEEVVIEEQLPAADVMQEEEAPEEETAPVVPAEEVKLESTIKVEELPPVAQVKAVAETPSHSNQYYILEGKLKDYVAQVQKAGKYNEKALVVCMQLFNDIVLYVLRYPFKENIELLFKTVVENKATVFSGTTLMTGINKLTETEQLRFGAFCTVLLQLADKKLKNLRITYSREAVALQLRNDTLVQALEAIRTRLEQ